MRRTGDKLYVTPVVSSREGAIRPGELLVELDAEGVNADELRAAGGSPYDPGSADTDWRERKGLPDSGPLIRRWAAPELRVQLWTGFPAGREVRLARRPGLHLNHVFFGLRDFYHGGPGGPPEPADPPKGDVPDRAQDERPSDVVILDTGLPIKWPTWHAALAGRLRPFAGVGASEDRLDEDGDQRLDEQAGHGLFIAGIANRVGPELGIDSSQVLQATGEGDEFLIGAVLEEALASSEAPVINLSLGAFIPGLAFGDSDCVEEPILATVIRRLIDKEKVIVAAAGNAGDQESYFEDTLFPASMPEVIAVGAFDPRNNGAAWAKSNPGDIYAPGVEVKSRFARWAAIAGDPAFKGWATWSGTSFATPVVAAAIADLLKQPGGGQPAPQRAWDWVESLATVPWLTKAFGSHGPARIFDPAPLDLQVW